MRETLKKARRPVHMGRNFAKIRTFLGIKQDSIATELNLSQSQVSNIEKQEVIEEPLLSMLAQAIGSPVELIKNFDEETAIYTINHYHVHDNSFTDSSAAQVFNPIEKIVELYERLLESEKRNLKN